MASVFAKLLEYEFYSYSCVFLLATLILHLMLLLIVTGVCRNLEFDIDI